MLSGENPEPKKEPVQKRKENPSPPKKESPKGGEPQGKKDETPPKEPATPKASIGRRAGETTPFAVQLHRRDQEIIRAVCDREGISQKRFFQYLIDGFVKGKEGQIRTAIEEYRSKNSRKESSLLS